MTLPIYQRVAQNDAGDVIPGAEYTVVNEATGLDYPIFSDRAGTVSKGAGPYFADAQGVIQFYIQSGITFRVEATGGVGTYTDRYIFPPHPQADPTDTTAGALMAVGAFGLGTIAATRGAIYADDLDDLDYSGTVYASAGSANAPPDAILSGIVVTEIQTSTRAIQLWYDSANLLFYRAKNTTWAAWLEIYHAGNLNQFEFDTSIGSNREVASGASNSTTTAKIRLPIALFAVPSSVTITGGFTVRDSGGASFGAATSANTTLLPTSSNRVAVLEVTGLVGIPNDDFPVVLLADNTSSKVTVNP